MKEELSIKYSQKYPITPEHKKALLTSGFMAPPFVFFLTLLGRHARGLSLTPIWIAIALGIFWCLLFAVGHRNIELELYKKMPPREKNMCVLYDSFIHDLFRTGVGIYTLVAAYWGVFEMGLEQGYMVFTIIILTVGGMIVTVSIWQSEWIAQVAIDGLKKHPLTRNVVAIVLSLFSAMPLLPGVANIVRVTAGQSGLENMTPFIMSALILFALIATILTLLGIMITHAHYVIWKQAKKGDA